jgi:hypothetical protein
MKMVYRSVDVLYPDNSFGTIELDRKGGLGSGKSKQVYLAETPDGNPADLVAECVFAPSGISRLLYKVFYGGHYPYSRKPLNDDPREAHPVRAAMYTRLVMNELSKMPGGFPVSNAYYTRVDEDGGNVMGTEYIEGRGPMIGSYRNGEPWEIGKLTSHMKGLREELHKMGGHGTEWQVNPNLSVPAKNFLHNGRGWNLIDLESGLPALAGVSHIKEGIARGCFPFFDDIDFAELRGYINGKRKQLNHHLGAESLKRLDGYVEMLEHHMGCWKDSELAPGRNWKNWGTVNSGKV